MTGRLLAILLCAILVSEVHARGGRVGGVRGGGFSRGVSRGSRSRGSYSRGSSRGYSSRSSSRSYSRGVSRSRSSSVAPRYGSATRSTRSTRSTPTYRGGTYSRGITRTSRGATMRGAGVRGSSTYAARRASRTYRGGIYNRRVGTTRQTGRTAQTGRTVRTGRTGRTARTGQISRSGTDRGFRRSPYASMRRGTTSGRRGGLYQADRRGGLDRGGLQRARTSSAFSRYGYRGAAGRQIHSGQTNYARHSYFGTSGVRLSFCFGYGPYYGCRYYYPWCHWSGLSYSFFYCYPTSWCYVPFGFYCDAPPVYVTRYVYVTEHEEAAAGDEYEVIEDDEPPAEPAAGEKEVEPEPAAGTPVAERYLREGTDAFRGADYFGAAKKFRLAALAAPENAGPLFALGQSLIAIGSDAYAARVLRKAILMNPDLVKEPADLVGVYKSQAEFDKVLAALRERAGHTKEGSDARFLLAAQLYFSADPQAYDRLIVLSEELSEDKVVALLAEASKKRFQKTAGELPPIKPEK